MPGLATFTQSRLDQVKRLPALDVVGPYDVLGEIATGGMAEICLGRHQRSQDIVALKRMRTDAHLDPAEILASFETEVFVLSSLPPHPNLLQLFEADLEGDAPFIAMEWVDGLTLSHVRHRARESRQKIPLDLIAHVALDVARGLGHAHRASLQGRSLSLVHRDVSPSNVMIRFDGGVKLLDFGVAKITRPGAANAEAKEGQLKGKFAYCSPEQARGEALHQSTDVFALGIVLHELFSGRSLFQRDDIGQTLGAVVHEPAPPLISLDPDISRELSAVIAKALEKKPSDRFSDGHAFADALEAATQNCARSDARCAEILHAWFPEAVGSVVAEETAPQSAAAQPPPKPTLAPASAGLDELELEIGELALQELRLSDFNWSESELIGAQALEPDELDLELDLPLRRSDPSTSLATESLATESLTSLRLSDPPTPREAPKRSSGLLLGVALVLLLGVIAAVAYLFIARSAKPEVLVSIEEPIPPPPTAPSLELTLTSVPEGADVYIDGAHAGQTPLTLSREEGAAEVAIQAEGYQRWIRALQLEESRTLNARLLPTVDLDHRAGQLSLSSDVPAEVWIGGELFGQTPLALAPVPTGDVPIVLRSAVEGERLVRVRISEGEPTILQVRFADLQQP